LRRYIAEEDPVHAEEIVDQNITDLKVQVDLARRQTDPASPEFVKPEGAKGIGRRVSNTDALSGTDRNSKPGTLRRLARSRPDLLARVESGELSAHAAAVEAGIRKPMRSIPVDTPDAAIRALLRVKARLRCEDPDCGIKGENPNIRFGRWVSTNFGETKRSQRIYEARRLWEVFGFGSGSVKRS
jgi:hypothetical protein